MSDLELLTQQKGYRKCCGTHPFDVPHRCVCHCHKRPIIDRVAIWDAINEYAAACGGDTSNATVSNRRMDAVSAVEKILHRAVHVTS